MTKITQRFIGLMILAVLLMSVMVNVPAKAKVIDVTPVAPFAQEIHYTFDDIQNRIVCSNERSPIVKFYIDNTCYEISIDDDDCVSWACCDDYGTLWIQAGSGLYWTNYELEGKNMIPHFFNSNVIIFSDSNCAYGYTFHPYDPNAKEIPLPKFDDLKKYIENGTPVPGSKPEPIKDSKPPVNSVPTPSTIQKVTISGNTIKLINSNNEVIDKATFNRKKATLSYKGKKVTKVKGAWFTKKGKVIYIKGSKSNYKAYYFDGKKSTLIKSKVASVSISHKFATALELKNGETYQLK